MTPEERAEKIVRAFAWDSLERTLTKPIAAQIREAVVEAKAYKLTYWHGRIEEAKSEAYEDAAKIAETSCHFELSERIRARANEMNK